MKAKRALDMYKKGQTVPPMLMQGLMPIIDMIDEIMSSNLANVRFTNGRQTCKKTIRY